MRERREIDSLRKEKKCDESQKSDPVRGSVEEVKRGGDEIFLTSRCELFVTGILEPEEEEE
jgi:hypothetical protein